MNENTGKTVTGNVRFFTAKTGTGATRACVKITGGLDGEQVTVQCWMDYSGFLPENLAILAGGFYHDPETGLIRIPRGMFTGSVKLPDDYATEIVQGRNGVFKQIAVRDALAFTITPATVKYVRVEG